MVVVTAFDLFLPYFYLSISRLVLFSKSFSFIFPKIDLHFDVFGASHGLDGVEDLMDHQGTTRVGSVNIKFCGVFHDLESFINGK